MTDAFCEALQHADRNVRGRAALDLGAHRDADAGDALIRALQVERRMCSARSVIPAPPAP